MNKNLKILYVGDSSDVIKRIIRNHLNGNVESSTLRRTIAERMGFNIKKTKRKSGSTRIRIESDDPKRDENKVSEYLESCKWKILFCENYITAHDFQ
ncbi:MAG: GIY-YIG nuclease family protein [Candidatus Helarchaeota archaeon]